MIEESTLAQIKQKLRAYNLKATQQRLVIYKALQATEGHPTAEQLYEMVSKDNPSLSLGTLYKTLEAFVAVQLIKKVACEDGAMRFDANLSTHNHIFCTNTQEIIDFEDKELHTLITAFLKRKNIDNFEMTDFQLQINGQKVNPKKKVQIT
ncbi:MAG: Fur family transcriptional regulator [Thermonemataceae bacterium]